MEQCCKDCGVSIFLLGAFFPNVEISTQPNYPTSQNIRNPSPHQVVSDFKFTVRYFRVSLQISSISLPRVHIKSNKKIPLYYSPQSFAIFVFSFVFLSLCPSWSCLVTGQSCVRALSPILQLTCFLPLSYSTISTNRSIPHINRSALAAALCLFFCLASPPQIGCKPLVTPASQPSFIS